MSKIFDTTIAFEVDDSITKEQFEEWFYYYLAIGGCSDDNPLIDEIISNIAISFDIKEV